MADKTENSGWKSRAQSALKAFIGVVEAGDDVREHEYGYGADYVGVDVLLGSGKRSSRSRVDIYRKFHYMMGDPIISSALRLHVTMALGGHETTGETVFIERKSDIKDGDKRAAIVDDLVRQVAPILNKHAHSICFNACGFGDAYGRVYTREKHGLIDIDTGELVYPPLVQPFDRANDTVGYVVSTGRRLNERLTIKQLARMKMPRMLYLPQTRALEKAIRQNIVEDDPELLQPLPALVGGSFLEAAEEPYDNLISSLRGLVSQRILSSIDETLVGVNLDGMTIEQRKLFMTSLTKMLKTMKDRADKHVRDGEFSTQRNIHVLPTSGDKQLTQISSFNGTDNGANVNIEDVMLHARLLSGALGIDLSMLGFADQLTGGLGEGGFNQTSAQAAERSGIIRTAFTEFANKLIDLHMLAKYGWVFDEGDRPFNVNFYGSIAALEAKEQASRERSMNATAMMVQTMQQLRDMGLPEDVVEMIFAQGMQLDADYAKSLAKGLKDAKPPEPQGGGGFGGGDFGGGDDDGPGGGFIPVGGSNNKEDEGDGA